MPSISCINADSGETTVNVIDILLKNVGLRWMSNYIGRWVLLYVLVFTSKPFEGCFRRHLISQELYAA